MDEQAQDATTRCDNCNAEVPATDTVSFPPSFLAAECTLCRKCAGPAYEVEE